MIILSTFVLFTLEGGFVFKKTKTDASVIEKRELLKIRLKYLQPKFFHFIKNYCGYVCRQALPCRDYVSENIVQILISSLIDNRNRLPRSASFELFSSLSTLNEFSDSILMAINDGQSFLRPDLCNSAIFNWI